MLNPSFLSEKPKAAAQKNIKDVANHHHTVGYQCSSLNRTTHTSP
jgi:hypothetical protein